MKFWRIITAAALVALLVPAAGVLAGGKCVVESQLVDVCNLALCIEREQTTANQAGGFFPWRNQSFFYSTYRSQFLYPSKTLAKAAGRAATIESIQIRASSFTSGQTATYINFNSVIQGTKGSVVKVDNAVSDVPVTTFALNTAPATNKGTIDSALTGPITVSTAAGCKGTAQLSDITSQPGATPLDRAMWITPMTTATQPNLLLDVKLRLGSGSGFTVWDLTDTTWGAGGCSAEVVQVVGNSSFVNPNHLTTAHSIHGTSGVVWVFKGKALPPPATVQQQIAEIIRLLITPEGLRCSGIDLTPGDKKTSDDPLNFPEGKDWESIMPTVGDSKGAPKTGEEVDNSPRSAGWRP